MKLTINVSPKNGKHTYSDAFDIISKGEFDWVDFMLNDLIFDNS